MNQGESGAQVAVDNSDAYVEEGTAPVVAETPVAEPAPETAPASEAGLEDNADGSEKAPKKAKTGWQRKIAKLEAENAALKAREAATQNAQSDVTPSKKPDPKDYPTYDDFVEALTDYKADEATDKKLKEREAQSLEHQLRKEMEDRSKAYDRQVEEVRKVHDDYDDVIDSYDGPLTVQMQQALLDSDMGAEIAYYLASNPEEAESIAGMTILGMTKAMGKIEARLEAGKKTEKAAVKTTKAPPPIVPVRTSASTASTVLPRYAGYEEF